MSSRHRRGPLVHVRLQADDGVREQTLVKVFGWYDNEWGYSNRLIDLAAIIGAPDAVSSRSSRTCALEGKRVLVRFDFNVPLARRRAAARGTDDFRIRADALQTLAWLRDARRGVTAATPPRPPEGKAGPGLQHRAGPGEARPN